jgi:hypothetical protein
MGSKFAGSLASNLATGAAFPSGSTSGGVSTTGAGAMPTSSTAALAQGLSLSPDLSYQPGGTYFGSSDTGKSNRNVWNSASLRQNDGSGA